jgi:lysophospholipase L1-like esterase
MTQILVFGDSIVYGAWDREGGWVQRLKNILDKKTLSDPNIYYRIYNLGVPGNVIEDVLKRFEFETEQRLKEDKEVVIIFAIRINDSQFIHSQNNLRTAPKKFEENLGKLINLAQKYSSKIIFVGLTPVDEDKVSPIPWDTNKSYKNNLIEKYNNVIKSMCKENKIYFINIFGKLINLDYKNLLEDGLHPNSEGHQKIFEIVRDFLTEKEMI